MTTLTKAVRDETIRNIMRESYAPRFADLRDRITAHVDAELHVTHQVFYKLLKDLDVRPYLDVQQDPYVMLSTSEKSHCGVRFPDFHTKPEFTRLHLDAWYRVEGAPVIKTGLSHPRRAGTVSLGAESPLAKEYMALWAALEEAWNTVESTLYGYKVRERFEADLPELAKHLPPAPVKTSALCVPVADIRAKLAAAGIPPTLPQAHPAEAARRAAR